VSSQTGQTAFDGGADKIGVVPLRESFTCLHPSNHPLGSPSLRNASR
jgi:hypothetical protein